MSRQTFSTISTTPGEASLVPRMEGETVPPLPPPSGRNFQLEVRGKKCTLASLLEELYQKSGTLHLWSLVRHIAGILEKSVEDLGTVCVAISPPLCQLRPFAGCYRPACSPEELLTRATQQ